MTKVVSTTMKPIIAIVAALLIVFFAYIYLQPNTSPPTAFDSSAIDSTADNITFSDEELADIPPTYNESMPIAPSNPAISNVVNSEPMQRTANTQNSDFRCDGRQHCSQMTSCAEATYFSNNCPNTKMDGNNDGIPCEQQWCR